MKICYKKIAICLLLLLLTGFIKAQKIKEYDLYVSDTIVNYTGKSCMAIAVNGKIPAPTLEFSEGDTAVIRVHNTMKQETSIHWHGLIVPNEQDGVPYLTSAPIISGTTHTYRFPIVQNGTYWYHSHSRLQEQIGTYGAFIINKKTDNPTLRQEDKLPCHTVILSEWTNIAPMEVNRMLHIGSDWFSIKKGSVQSYWEAIDSKHFTTKIVSEWKRMKAMDISDIYYEQFLINGKNENSLSDVIPGSRIRLRIINAGASSYFWLQFSGGKIMVIATDGQDVEPIEVDRLIIAAAETYDVVITIPDDRMAYELLAISEDRTGSASLRFGEGHKMTVSKLAKLKYFEGMKMMNRMMKINGDMDAMGMSMTMQKMDMNKVMYPEETNGMSNHDEHSDQSTGSKDLVTLNYGMLKSPIKTNLPDDAPFRELRFELTGNMDRYVWALDNKTVSESDKILIRQDENLRIIIHNNTMMRHPMHLHGHFFRIVNGQGDYAPLKHTLDIMPMETDTLELRASENYGDWYFHCHILYHMMSGMGRIFVYEDSPPNPQIPDPHKAMRQVKKDDRMLYLSAQNDFLYSGNVGNITIENTRWQLKSEWNLGYSDRKGYDYETHIGRYIGKMQWFMPYIGFDWRYRKKDETNEKNLFGQKQSKERGWAIYLGFQYTLPMLIIADVRIDSDGKLKLQLSRDDIALTSRLRMQYSLNTDKEYSAGLNYIITKHIGLSVIYDSERRLGAGVRLNY